MKHPCASNCIDRSPYCRTNCDKWKEYEAKRNELYKHRLTCHENDIYTREAQERMKKCRSSNGMRLV